jgi:DNA-binding response OmpR family regulator
MTLQALLVSKDDQAAETLTRAMAGFGVAVERSSDPEIAASRIAEHNFDAIVVDFDEAGGASSILHVARLNTPEGRASQIVTVALVSDASQVRGILGAGAHFILTKPVSEEQASATLRAATSLLKRERRRSLRVPVQAAATLALADGTQMEGIMLDLSDSGMDVLAAQPLAPSALVSCRFTLPDGSYEIETQGEVAWANPNGQSGIRFLDMDEATSASLVQWLEANSPDSSPVEEEDSVADCKLTDLSLGGCYVQTESPFPERSSVDLCLRAADLEIHAAGTVRVMHPGHGMGIEFPSRTEEQRKVVGDFIEFLTSQPGTMPELLISPKSLLAEEAELASAPDDSANEDPLLELLHNGQAMEQDEFLSELRRQRNSEPVNS